MAKERKIRRKQTPAQELRKIERLLGEEFDSLAQARRALKQESVKPKGDSKPTKLTSKPSTKSIPKTPPKFNIRTALRKEKILYARKVGAKKYHQLLKNWEQYRLEHEDLALQPDDNPYFYHVKE